MNKRMILGLSVAFLLLLTAGGVMAASPASPPGCNADTSVVNIARSTASAEVGQTITFTVSAGNPASDDGCDITGRTMTLTLPDGSTHVFGPSDYPNPTAVSFVGSANYVASITHLVGGTWPATVTWTGTLLDGEDSRSNGDKAISVSYKPVNLEVTKTAVPASALPYTWTIYKSVTPATWDLFAGDSGESQYTIAVTKTAGTQTYSVNGSIKVHNPAQFASATITGVTDSISGVGAATVNCPVSFPYTLGSGQTLECTYNRSLPDGTTRTNTATATTSGDVNGGTGNASIDFTGVVPVKTNDSINVTDTNPGAGPWQFSASGSVTYNKTFDCSGITYADNHGHKTVDNTAEITETHQTDGASVAITCYKLIVEKTASTTYQRKYDWSILKDAAPNNINISPGQTYVMNYTISVNLTGFKDSDWAVSGDITVANTHPSLGAEINSVSDIIEAGGITGTVTCPSVTFPFTIPVGNHLDCHYSAGLPNANSRTNTATATQQNYFYPFDDDPETSGTSNYIGTASVTFGAPTSVIDEAITVTDPMFGGTIGTVTVGVDTLSKIFNLPYTIGSYADPEDCGDQFVDNTATLTTNDTRTTLTSSKRIVVHVECVEGCTLTQGYWKTHSEFGKAPYDDTWASLTSGASTPFYLSGQTWYQVFWTPPKGNVYYQLAHQYMAAKLNILNEAEAPANVLTAIAKAETLFGAHTPAQTTAWMGKTKGLRDQFLSAASTLASFNEGYIGPGHCDEDKTSAR